MRKTLALAAFVACVSSLSAQDAFKSIVDGAAAPDPIRTTAPAPAGEEAPAPLPVIAPVPAADAGAPVPAAPAPAAPTVLPADNVVATVGGDKDGVVTVPLPGNQSADKVLRALDLGIDVKEPTMMFNDVLLLLNRLQDVPPPIVATELCDPEIGRKKVTVTQGRVALRDFLNQVCLQIGGTWMVDENNVVVISPVKQTTVTEGADPAKVKINVDFAKVPLGNVADNIAKQTGVTINVAPEARDVPVEIIINGWDAERIIKYIAGNYGLRYEKTGPNAFNIMK